MAGGMIDLTSVLMGGVTGLAMTVPGYDELAYPLQIPSVSGVSEISWGVQYAQAITRSPFTLHEQIFRHRGERWNISVTLPVMTRESAAQWQGFLLALDGMYGSFLFGDYFHSTPSGLAYGDPVVEGNGQGYAKTLETRGWEANVEGILKAGDKIQLGSYLYMILRDANSDASGYATFDIFPRLRASPTDGDSIITSRPRGVFSLASTAFNLSSRGLNGLWTMPSFSIKEVI